MDCLSVGLGPVPCEYSPTYLYMQIGSLKVRSCMLLLITLYLCSHCYNGITRTRQAGSGWVVTDNKGEGWDSPCPLGTHCVSVEFVDGEMKEVAKLSHKDTR